jgi:hypothetical protein
MRAGTFERCALLGMALGVGLMLQPWWSAGLRIGFFATLAFTVLQIVAGHLPRGRA